MFALLLPFIATRLKNFFDALLDQQQQPSALMFPAANQPLDMGTLNLHHAVQRSVSTGNPITDALLVTVLISVISQMNLGRVVANASHTVVRYLKWACTLLWPAKKGDEEEDKVMGQITFSSVILTGTSATSTDNKTSIEFRALLHEVTERSSIIQQRCTVVTDSKQYQSATVPMYYYTPCNYFAHLGQKQPEKTYIDDTNDTWIEVRFRDLHNQGYVTSPSDAEHFDANPSKAWGGRDYSYSGAISASVTIMSRVHPVLELKKRVDVFVQSYINYVSTKPPAERFAFYSTFPDPSGVISSSVPIHVSLLGDGVAKSTENRSSIVRYMQNLIRKDDVDSCYTIHDLVLPRATIDDIQFRLDLTKKCNVPFTILLTGVPGSGKTACIRAIQKYLDVHVVMPALHHVESKGFQGLFDIFFGNYVNNYPIAPQERMIALEEFDLTWGKVMLNRNKQKSVDDMLKEANNDDSGNSDGGLTAAMAAAWKRKEEEEEKGLKKFDNEPVFSPRPKKDVLTLADWLKVMDGPQKRPGQVLVLVSNELPDLDPAVVRPGRIDMILRFGYLTTELLPKAFASACSHVLRIQRPLLLLSESTAPFDFDKLANDVQEQVISFITENGDHVTNEWLEENKVTISSISTQLKYNPSVDGVSSYREAVRAVLETFLLRRPSSSYTTTSGSINGSASA
jgi:hypothetical protein